MEAETIERKFLKWTPYYNRAFHFKINGDLSNTIQTSQKGLKVYFKQFDISIYRYIMKRENLKKVGFKV